MPQELKKAQEDLKRETQAVDERWKVEIIASTLAGLLVSAFLLFGAIRSLGLTPVGRKLLIGAALSGILCAVGGVVLQIVVQQDTQVVVNKYMKKVTNAQRQGRQAGPDVEGVMNMTMIVSMVAVVVWGLIKIAFYVVTLTYLAKPNVAALFVRGFGQRLGEQPFDAPPGHR